MEIGEGIPVYLSHHSITPDLIGCHGITQENETTKKLEIFICAAQPRERQNQVYCHEFFHACIWGKKSLHLHYKKEESIASEIGTTGWRCMKIPRRPKGAVALEKYARKYDERIS